MRRVPDPGLNRASLGREVFRLFGFMNLLCFSSASSPFCDKVKFAWKRIFVTIKLILIYGSVLQIQSFRRSLYLYFHFIYCSCIT